ncbi:hypothetical protein C2S53_003686 [Perilla frutescens var. hirtella]|uniref:Uncharacterized protein n=1 Tax=Perilla frutescens var. hirtella TaxID=608512 RepID=A0AAD4IP49_PERFH|nr:hypothetical protein C2S53_003686 [Perilla frutescens var. hirtella]
MGNHKLPLFSVENYDNWSRRMKAHLCSIHENMWEVIEDGPITIMMDNEAHIVDVNQLARIPKSTHFLTNLCQESEAIKGNKLQLTVDKYESFKMQPEESISSLETGFLGIISEMTNLGRSYPNSEMSSKVLDNLTEEWDMKVITTKESRNLNNIIPRELFDYLKAHEYSLKRKSRHQLLHSKIQLFTVKEISSEITEKRTTFNLEAHQPEKTKADLYLNAKETYECPELPKDKEAKVKRSFFKRKTMMANLENAILDDSDYPSGIDSDGYNLDDEALFCLMVNNEEEVSTADSQTSFYHINKASISSMKLDEKLMCLENQLASISSLHIKLKDENDELKNKVRKLSVDHERMNYLEAQIVEFEKLKLKTADLETENQRLKKEIHEKEEVSFKFKKGSQTLDEILIHQRTKSGSTGLGYSRFTATKKRKSVAKSSDTGILKGFIKPSQPQPIDKGKGILRTPQAQPRQFSHSVHSRPPVQLKSSVHSKPPVQLRPPVHSRPLIQPRPSFNRTERSVDSKINIHSISQIYSPQRRTTSYLRAKPKMFWYLDSGCFKHMTRDRKVLDGFMVKGKVVVNGVSHVDGLKHKLLSISQLCDNDYSVDFNKNSCDIRDKLTGEILLTSMRKGNMYVVDWSTGYSEACFLSKGTTKTSWLWHRRLNHINFKTISYLSKKGLVEGLSKEIYKKTVYMGARKHGDHIEQITKSHHEMLASAFEIKAEAIDSMIYSYRHGFSGFAAKMSESQAKYFRGLPGVVEVFPNYLYTQQTTRSWDYLGLSASSTTNLVHDTNQGDGAIIGVIDTGVWPESESFNEKGLGPIPSKWKGFCQSGDSFTPSKHCNKKLIGARYFVDGLAAELNHNYQEQYYNATKNDDYSSARDKDGHGTHTASTAGGSFVSNVSVSGLARGTARGGAPKARVAMYKVLWNVDGGSSIGSAIDILKAFDEAIHDGVDVLSLSLGFDLPLYPEIDKRDIIYYGTFHAAEQGIVPVCSAGNSGPLYGTVEDVAPWVITVAASTIDRSFPNPIILGNNQVFAGQGMYIGDDTGFVDLVFFEDRKPPLPPTDPKVRLKPVQTYVGIKATSYIASFSSRGPNSLSPSVLKPDIAAPGVDIVGAVPGGFDFNSGTSMACPHIAGISALLKSLHPNWSPAAIKSAIVTTAWTSDPYTGEPIYARGEIPRIADNFDYGGGLVNPNAARNPGLVYDIETQDYINYLCAMGYAQTDINQLAGTKKSCPKSGLSVLDLNLPSITVSNLKGSVTVTRTVTNVGNPNSNYEAVVVAPFGTTVKVNPSRLVFNAHVKKLSFTVTITGLHKTNTEYYFGSLIWTDKVHQVRIPLSIKTEYSLLLSD